MQYTCGNFGLIHFRLLIIDLSIRTYSSWSVERRKIAIGGPSKKHVSGTFGLNHVDDVM